jgi:protein-tyrosine phosphatase
MDRDNLANLRAGSDTAYHQKIRLFLEYSAGPEAEVPDPYYGGATGFERVLDLIEDASERLIDDLRQS